MLSFHSFSADDETYRRKVEGGAMQITLYKMAFDYYPYHPAGLSFFLLLVPLIMHLLYMLQSFMQFLLINNFVSACQPRFFSTCIWKLLLRNVRYKETDF